MISYQNVTKRYGDTVAVSGFSLEIGKGEFFGLLGPNGAGKTTLIRMTTTLTPLSSGLISIGGEPIDRNLTASKRKVGIVPQYSNLEDELSALQNLEYHGRLYGMSREARQRRALELLDFAELRDRRGDKTKTFSGGMRRKLMIAKSLMHHPAILLLDEPTVGLDALWRRRIWNLIRKLRQGGLTILLTTHYLEEAQTLCDRVGMIDGGVLKKTGAPRDLIREAGKYVLEYFRETAMVQQFFEVKDKAIEAAREVSGDFEIREANLEDVFILLTNKRLEE
jgi:ABC-2 type transport system ATP-binding protein